MNLKYKYGKVWKQAFLMLRILCRHIRKECVCGQSVHSESDERGLEYDQSIEPEQAAGLGFKLRVAGLEPARYRYRGILSPLCLPIPPYPHEYEDIWMCIPDGNRNICMAACMSASVCRMLLVRKWAKVDSNHRSNKQQIYSLSPLATREFAHIWFVNRDNNTIETGKDQGVWEFFV